MSHVTSSLPRLLIFALAAIFLGAGQAHAKRVPKLYTFGPVNSEVGPIKKEVLKSLSRDERIQLEALGADTVGFNYKHFGLFWLDIWSWGGEYTVYNKLKDIPYGVSKATAAAFLGISESQLTKPLSYHIPWGLVVIVGLVLLKTVPRFLIRRKQSRSVPQYDQGPVPNTVPGTAPKWTPLPAPPADRASPPPPAGSGPPPVPPPLPPDQH